ncbi:amino acid dehydrogenase [Rhodococcus ruber Chol-4]|uniref:NAD(P)/FAD-dependent oxidoreductase n=1 Tax=Rhodococcus TaxID=1827 RepID=UPI0003465A92|nr:FAD-dependent oxidoreductase [Rhodococcus ruber]KXF83849.1 amino acid dehydrogenase [Rhodococcus ruber Chol-4]MDO1479314.1 FAD-dependent oxidoreductase [Rhodococcus ruber]MDO2377931.1 FAD-dependent oxidoreductase [Rhodococcus ruber]WKK09853.1 FAD-dependent oxidoreductase [Rhodococcus ruber]
MAIRRVVVVGAGFAGLSTAWFLQERGVEVTVLDRTGVAADASWGNAGWLAPALTLPLPEPAVLRYGIRSMLTPSSPVYVPPAVDLRLWRFLVGFARHCTPRRWRAAMTVFAEVNRSALGAYDDLARGGVVEQTRPADPFLAAFASEDDRRVLVEEFRQVVAAGGEVDFDLLDGDTIRTLEPLLGDGVRAGIRLRGQRFVDPPRFVAALADSVRDRGGAVVTGCEVQAVRDDARGVRVVGTDGADRAADAVVLATGARLTDLVRPFGVRTPVQAGRGYSFSVRPADLPKNPIYFPAQRVACTPLHDRFRIAGMMEFRRPDAPLDPRRIQAIVDAARPLLTGIDWSARTEEWVGSRPCTPDGLPLVGGTRSARVFVAGGHGMWGVALGPLTGRLLADAMTGTPAAVLRHFDPLR